MNGLNIPRSFWHSVSLCLVSSIVVLLLIAYRSSSVSIEISSAKVHLSSAVQEAKVISGQLEKERDSLIKANDSLKEMIITKNIEISSMSNLSCEEIESKMCMPSHDFFNESSIDFSRLKEAINEANISVGNIRVQ
ncbi:hypothetical protein ACVBE9_12080 [Eionea flava]